MEPDLSRGKRTLAKQLLVFNGAMAVTALWLPEAMELTKFLVPFVFPSAIGLYIGDAYFHSKSISTPPK